MTRGHDVVRFDTWASTYERHWMQRIIFEPIQSTVLDLAAQGRRPEAILDVGCGTGRLLRAAHDRFPDASLAGVDAAPEMVKQAQALDATGAIRFQHATAESLPFPDASFDLVLSTVTFHHWHDQARGAAEVARVLKSDGRWLLADFMPIGLAKWAAGLLRLRQFPERTRLQRLLQVANLAPVTDNRVPGLMGQVAVAVIARKAAAPVGG